MTLINLSEGDYRNCDDNPDSVLKVGDVLESELLRLIKEKRSAIDVVSTIHTAAMVGLAKGTIPLEFFNRTGSLFNTTFPIDND